MLCRNKVIELLIKRNASPVAAHVSNKRNVSIESAPSAQPSEKHVEEVSRYPTFNIKDLPIVTQEQMYSVDDKSGFVPNLYHALAYQAEQFECFVRYRSAIMKREGSNLKKEDLELVGLVASLHFKCLYCIIAHSALHRVFSKSSRVTDQMIANMEAADLTPKQRAIVSLASTVARYQPVEEQQFKELRKHGLDKNDAWDIAALVSFTAMASSMIKFLNVRPNEEYYTMGR